MRSGRLTREDVDQAVLSGEPMSLLLSHPQTSQAAFVTLHPEELAQLEMLDDRLRAWPDLPLRPLLDQVAVVSHLDETRRVSPNLNGEGIVIGVVDSGLDTTHPDFAGRIAHYEDITGSGVADTVGHGTHVSSIALGSGSVYRGVAPGASLVAVKAGDETLALSLVFQGIALAVGRGARVINLSIGAEIDYDPDHPLSVYIETLTARGIFVVCAAGNSGPDDGTIHFPASVPSAIAVGSVDKTERIATTSSRGPTSTGHAKPDIVAVGVSVTAAMSKDCPDTPIASGSRYTVKSGTSMASPFIAGLCALLLQANPTLSHAALRSALLHATVNLNLPINTQGSGMVDAYRVFSPTNRRPPMSQMSLGLSSSVLGNYGLARMMEFGVIDLYSGPPPEYAHWAPNGVWLARITKGGGVFSVGSPTNGLELDRSEQGAVKDTGDWVLTCHTSGTVGWWRWKWYLDDPNTTDPYFPRLDGVLGDSLTLHNHVLRAGETTPIDRFYLSFVP